VEYKALHDGIRARRPEFPQTYCGVEWGWHADGDNSATSHKLLSDAERNLGGRAIKAVDDPSDFTLNLLRVAVEKFRPLMIYNFSDMFYYTSEDGKNALRYAVAERIVEAVGTVGGEPISLTLLGHSAGSVIAFDFLFYLFFSPRTVTQFIRPEKVRTGPSTRSGVARSRPQVDQTLTDLERLKSLAQAGQLRVRRLFTFGSPITPLACRSDAILDVLARNSRLSSADYGLLHNDAAFGPPLTGPRWVNIWDKDDVIAWPVEPLMTEAGSAVVDRYVDVSDSPTSAHSAYWTSPKVHAEMARSW
jgi:hypothetical protein